MTKCRQRSLPLLLFTVYISHSHMKEDKAVTDGYQLAAGSTWYAERAPGGVAPKFLKVSQALPNKEAKSRK